MLSFLHLLKLDYMYKLSSQIRLDLINDVLSIFEHC